MSFFIEISFLELFGHFYFLAFMLWWAQFISDCLGFIASAEARLRLDQKFLVQQGLENRGQVYFWKSAHLKNAHLKVY